MEQVSLGYTVLLPPDFAINLIINAPKLCICHRLRKYFNMKIKVEDGHRIEDFANTGKTWATYLTECNVDRVEHSIQCVGIAVLSTYFNLSTKTNICTLDDRKNLNL